MKRIYRQTDQLFICRESGWITDVVDYPRTTCESDCGAVAVRDLPDWAIRQLVDSGQATLRINVGRVS